MIQLALRMFWPALAMQDFRRCGFRAELAQDAAGLDFCNPDAAIIVQPAASDNVSSAMPDCLVLPGPRLTIVSNCCFVHSGERTGSQPPL